MVILLDDTFHKDFLFPFAQVRSIVHIRIGICTILEKWQHYFPGRVRVASEHFMDAEERSSCIVYPSNLIPSGAFLQTLAEKKQKLPFTNDCRILEHPWQVFQWNDWAIREDFTMITQGRTSAPLAAGNQAVAAENIFIEEGAKVSFSVINAAAGPVYIGHNAEIEEGTLLRGPVVIGEGSRVKMGTRIYGAATIGPYSLAGGEIKNAVLMGFSNKAHDGYLGDSVLGQWCNLGAGTSNSNLKNNVSGVRVWSKKESQWIMAGEKCGLLMGDYSRSAINTSFNTGTIVGISCNVFGEAFPPKFIDSFSWGKEKYELDKAIRDIVCWKKLKNRFLSEEEIQSLKKIY